MKHLLRFFLVGGLILGFGLIGAYAEELPAQNETTPSGVFEISPGTQNITWVTDNYKRGIALLTIESNPFISITDLARLSEAQLGWQAVTQQACLSKIHSLVCFNWGKSRIYLDGSPISQKYQVSFVGKNLYVSFPFVTSKYFQKFSQTELTFNEAKSELVQKIPVTLEIPPVENLGDFYRLSLNVGSEKAFRILRQDKGQIWLRFLGGQTTGSSILEGDNVIREIKIVQKRRCADMIVKLGGASSSYDLEFSPENQKLNLRVFLKGPAEYADTPVEHGKDFKPVAELLPPLPSEPKINSGPVEAIPVSPPTRLPKAGVVSPNKSGRAGQEKGVRTVLVDAGHGGFDSGAMGVRGTFEKDINLRVAEEVAERLKKDKNLRVVLTRQTDIFLPLDERTKMANEAGADLFVSIHCNSSISAKHSGFEVYLLAAEASDEAAAAVARFENSVVALESKKGDSSDKLTGLLASMAVNTYMNDSSELAAMVCRGVKKTSAVKETAVKEANFHVLRGAQMPSVLVELDYLSNPISELKLRSSRFTSIVAKGIAQGVQEFDERMRKKEEIISARFNHQRSAVSGSAAPQ